MVMGVDLSFAINGKCKFGKSAVWSFNAGCGIGGDAMVFVSEVYCACGDLDSNRLVSQRAR